MEKPGSEKLLADLGRGRTFNKEDLARILELRELAGARLVDVCRYGQSGVDGICGRLHVDIDKSAKVFEHFVKLADLKVLFEAFPYGIKAPDMFDIQFQAGRIGG